MLTFVVVAAGGGGGGGEGGARPRDPGAAGVWGLGRSTWPGVGTWPGARGGVSGGARAWAIVS